MWTVDESWRQLAQRRIRSLEKLPGRGRAPAGRGVHDRGIGERRGHRTKRSGHLVERRTDFGLDAAARGFLVGAERRPLEHPSARPRRDGDESAQDQNAGKPAPGRRSRRIVPAGLLVTQKHLVSF
jgi:hypothetical protein